MNAGVRILPLEEWPAPDQAMWHRATQAGGFFDAAGPLAHLAAPTLGMIRTAYGKWLTWLTETRPDVLMIAPEARLRVDRFIAFVEAVAYLSPKTRHLYAANTLRLVSSCHPGQDWDPLRGIVMHLHREAKDHVSHRKDGRILAGNHVLATALDLAGPVAGAAKIPLKRALLQRNGTLIAFLALIPIRRRALTSLRLGESVVLDGEGILIATPPGMTKTRTHWETVVPSAIFPVLRRYIDETRPWLMARGGRDHSALWVTKDGDPICGSAMGTLIRNQTRELFGVPISPHLFRDIAATTLARVSPEAVGHLRPLLGHRGAAMAETYYNHATALEIGRNHACLIDNLKERH